MERSPANPAPSGDHGDRVSAAWVFLPMAFLAAILLFYPFRYIFEFDTDEGINAIKALLSLRGFGLYTQVWSDQPPLFTFLLALWFRLFGLRVVAGRLMVLLFSVGVVALGVHYLRRSWGAAAAVAGVVFLFLLPLYRQLSVSMMIGLPSIALALLSFWAQAMWHDRRRAGWLFLSGTALALSVLTKMFTLILAPIWLVGILWVTKGDIRRSPSRFRPWLPALAWAVPFAVILALAVLLVIRPENLGQLFDVHLAAEQTQAFQPSALLPSINFYLMESLPLLILAALGVVRAIQEKRWSALYLAAWAAAGYVFLLANHPTWPHHQLLVTVPAALLAAAGVGAAFADLSARSRSSLPRSRWAVGLASLAVAVAVLVLRAPPVWRELDASLPNLSSRPSPAVVVRESQEREIVALMSDHAGEARWVFTDRPMFAFASGLSVPPVLAVLSSKRLITGQLTETEILEALETYKPELILAARFDLPVVQEYMRTRNYRRIDSTLRYRLYFRPDSP